MWNSIEHPMALYGVIAAGIVYAIFLGSWWFYAARVDQIRGLLRRGEAVLLHVDPAGSLDPTHVENGLHIPFKELEARMGELGARGRKIVVCAHRQLLTLQAASLLRGHGFTVYQLDHV